MRRAQSVQLHFDPSHWYRWWALHLSWWRADLSLLAKRAVREFLNDHCPQLAASMSYYVLFSLFPLTILVVSIAGLLLTDDSLRERAIDGLVDILPAGAGREDLESLIEPIASGRSALGVFSVLGLLWGATGMMSALRHSLDTAWDLEYRRPFVRGKLVDLGLIICVGGLLALSIGTTALLQVGRDVSTTLSDALGPFGASAHVVVDVLAVVAPYVLSVITFTVIYKVVPSLKTRVRDVIAGALVAGALFEVLKHGFAFYLRNFSNYDAVYGSLGATIALLFFVYLAACVLLLGAEIASEWPRIMQGHYDDELEDAVGGEDAPWSRRVLLAVTGMVADEGPEAQDATAEESAREARAERRAAQRSERLARAPEPPLAPEEAEEPAPRRAQEPE